MTHEEWMDAINNAYEMHPGIKREEVLILELAELQHFNNNYRTCIRDIDNHHTTKIDIINNFDGIKRMCQEEIWSMLKRESAMLVNNVVRKDELILNEGEFEILQNLILNTDALNKFMKKHNSMIKKAEEVKNYLKNETKNF